MRKLELGGSKFAYKILHFIIHKEKAQNRNGLDLITVLMRTGVMRDPL